MVERLVRHPEAVRTYPDDVPGRISDISDDLHSEESVDGVFGVEAFEDPVAVPGVEVEGPEDLPSSEVVDDFHQWLLAVALYETEFHASLKKCFFLFSRNLIIFGFRGSLYAKNLPNECLETQPDFQNMSSGIKSIDEVGTAKWAIPLIRASN